MSFVAELRQLFVQALCVLSPVNWETTEREAFGFTRLAKLNVQSASEEIKKTFSWYPALGIIEFFALCKGVKAVTLYSDLGVVRLFHLLNKGIRFYL